MDVEEQSRRLVNHVAGAVQRATRLTNDVALSVRGEPASALLAALLREQSDVPTVLVWVGRGDAGPPVAVRALARHLGLSLVERVHPAVPVHRAGDAPEASLPFYDEAREARVHAERLLLPDGAPPAFLDGPTASAAAHAGGDAGDAARRDRFVGWAKGVRLDVRFPYVDPGVLAYLHRGVGGLDGDGEGASRRVIEAALRGLGLPDGLLRPAAGPQDRAPGSTPASGRP